MLNEVVIGKRYRNIKNQLLYKVASIGFHTELEEVTVHYVPLYDGNFYDDYYRPLELFKVKFEEVYSDDVRTNLDTKRR